MNAETIVFAGILTPFDLVAVILILLPFAAILAYLLYLASSSGSSQRKSSAPQMLMGLLGAIIGGVTADRIYWQSRGPENEFLWIVPGILIGGLVFILVARLFRRLVSYFLRS